MSLSTIDQSTGNPTVISGNVNDKVGNLAALTTTDKSSAVGAINEVKSGLTKSVAVVATVRCASADSNTIGYRSTGADEVAISSLPNYPTGRTILGYNIESCYNGSMTKICLASIFSGVIHVNSPVASEGVTVVIRVYYI